MHRKLLTKRNLIITALLLAICLCWYLHFQLQQNARGQIVSDQISNRAQEFIRKESSQGTGMWSTARLEKSDQQQQASNSVITTPCFSFTLPVETVNSIQENTNQKCVFRAKTLAPVTNLVVASYHTDNPAEDSGILLRDRQSDIYTKHPLNVSGFSGTAFFSSNDSFTAFAWQEHNMLTISMTGVVQPQLIKPEFFEQVLNSFHFLFATQSATAAQ